MTTLRTLTLLLGLSCLVPAATEHADLPAGGAVRLKNSTGDLTIEGWDQPGVELTTTKSGLREKDVTIAMTRDGNDLVIMTVFPRHRRFLPRPSVGARDFDLNYLIKIPRDAKLIIEHDAGEIHLEGLTGDVRATMNQGMITVRIPADSQYSVDAASRIGDVTSDIAGTKSRKHLGHALLPATTAPHTLYLRTGFGDIIVLRERH